MYEFYFYTVHYNVMMLMFTCRIFL